MSEDNEKELQDALEKLQRDRPLGKMIEIDDDESAPAPLPEGVQSMEDMPLRWSKRRAKFAAALAKAQGEIELADKDRRNTHLKSSYASLGGIREVGRIPLSKNGIAVIQGPRVWGEKGDRVTVLTQLVHESGQWVECELTFVADYMKGLNWMQVIGNVIAYARRYTLTAITGVAVSEDEHDDDGQGLADDTRDQRDDERRAAPRIKMPTTYEEYGETIDGLKTLEESSELWRMKRYIRVEMSAEQAAALERKWSVKHNELKKASEAGAPPPAKSADITDDIKRRKAEKEAAGNGGGRKADDVPSTFSCALCDSEIRIKGKYLDSGYDILSSGAPRCSGCKSKGRES